MSALAGTVTVAAVQTTPAFLDRDATTDVLVRQVKEASVAGAGLVVFPEAVLPGYPDWVWRRPAWSDGSWYERLHDQAVDVPGEAVERLGAAARDAEAWVVVGVTERVRSGTLYNTLLYLDPSGQVAGRHRKLVATGGERTIWGQGCDVTVVDAGFARVGGLICWENLMPLARAAIYELGVEVYLAPTWDSGDAWLATLRHIAREGRVFVIGTNSCLRGSDVPRTLPGADDLYGDESDWMSRGNTAIVGPDGTVIVGPLVGESGMLLATLDLAELRTARREFDVVGHYARPDLFRSPVALP
jgi:nitrilase